MKLPPFLAARSPRERGIIIGLGGLVLVGIAFVLFGGSGEEPFAPLPTFSPRVSTSPTPTSTLPVTPPVFEGKDPFEPLVREQAGGGPAPSGSPSPGPSGGPTGGGSNTSGQSRRVVLVDIFTEGGERQATVTVDGTEYTVRPGDTFATNYRLLSLTSSCGTFVFGDERFTLCIGQEVRK